MDRRFVRSLALRYGASVLAFLLPVFISIALNRLKINVDLTLLVLGAIIASAWYGGTGPGVVTALLFEVATFTLSNPRPVPLATRIIIEVNRTGLLLLLVFLVSSRKKVERNLRDQREWLQVTLSSIGDAVIAADLGGRVTFMNPAAEQITGWSASEAKKRPIDEVFTVVDKDSHETVPNRVLKLAHEEAGANAARDLMLKSRTGAIRSISYTSAPIRSQAGDRTGAVLVIRDVTDHAHLEDQFRQAQKMEAVGRLAGGMAHDFNNLLTAIIGYSDLLMHKTGSDPAVRRELEEISEAGRRAAMLTGQLLAFSRKQVLQPKVLDLNETVIKVERMLRRLIGEDIDMITVPGSNLGRIRADSGQIEQILMNLAVNSRDAMPNGGKLTIETANVELDEAYSQTHAEVTPGHYVLLAVSDTGQGMDPETQSHIFEPFFTTKEQGKGTGLGLSMVYGVVKQSGGHIWVYSEPGHGVDFKLYFPRVDQAEEAPSVPMDSVEPQRGTERILLVEDDDAVRKLAQLSLERYGYTVLAADRGAHALEAFGPLTNAIDLVITDVIMPEMSGATLVAKLKKLHPEIKVLYVSGYTEEATIHHGVLNDGVEFLQKPFTPDSLARKVREVLGKHSGEEEVAAR